MNQRRRRAENFTDSLNSFQNITESESTSNTLYSISQDSLDELKSVSNHTSNDAIRSAKHSIILSGNSAKDLYQQDSSNSSTILYRSTRSEPDLNKRINSSETKQLCNKVDDYKENNNPQYALKDKKFKNDVMSKQLTNTPISHDRTETNIMNENSKRDTNHNIHNKSEITTIEHNVLKSVLDSQLSFNCTNENTLICDKNLECELENDEVKKFETILCSLDNQLNQMKETSKTQVLKRLSNKFMNSPQNFTEKLLTIIEESIINNDNDKCDTSALNLSRLTMEFRKMCKFLEDESAPEWVASPPPLSIYLKEALKSPSNNKSDHIKTSKMETTLSSPLTVSTPITPISGIDVMRKRFFNKISKNNFNGSADSVVNISDNESSTSFERLEAQCGRLYPEEVECSKPLHRSLSVPSLLNMNKIKQICEKQMASLNVSDSIDQHHKENIIFSSPNLFDRCQSSLKKREFYCPDLQQETYNRLKNFQHDKLSYSKKKSKKISEKSDISEVQVDKTTSGYIIVDPDELEKTLLQDIAEKRKRCLDTARLITEINADPEVIEAQKSLRMSPMFVDDNESYSLINDEAKFLKTLMSCKDYQTYLEKQKPFFKLFQNSNPCTPDSTLKDNKSPDLKYKTPDSKENFNTKKSSTKGFTLSTNLKSCSPYKSPLSKQKGKEKEEKKENIKPRLFVTPGNTPPSTNCKRKKTYFPSMASSQRNTTRNHILKSPHAEGLYRLNYNTIISPVGMYIRGTDMQLIKNVRAKTDDLLLTPLKKNVKATSNKNLKQSTPLKDRNEICEKPTLRINVSPKLGTNYVYKPEAIGTSAPENDSTPKNHFVLPKVSYKLPLQVKTIKENKKSPKPGTRVKKLLESAQSKVVIRHKARVNSVQKQQTTTQDGVYEIHYEPEDESVHIEQAANKTNFICRRKNV